jgi:Ni/Co efflux regulator RcnB
MRKFLTAAVALSVLASAGAASAAPYDQRRDSRHVERLDRQADRADRQADRAERRADRAEARYERRAERRYQAGRYQRPAGYQHREWRHGDRLPASYRSRSYAVDHRRYGLQAPPRGYQYTRVDNNAVLTAVATGVIASVVVGLFQ